MTFSEVVGIFCILDFVFQVVTYILDHKKEVSRLLQQMAHWFFGA